MSGYRGELRVFGLILLALLASSLLYGTLSTATVSGEFLGAEYTVGGPAALFVILLLIFSWRGLLTFKVEDRRADTLSRPIDKMTLDEARRAIDDFQADANEIQRKREALQKYVAVLEQSGDPEAALVAMGMRPAHRRAPSSH